MRWIDLGLTLAGLPICAAGLYLAGLAAFSRRLANPIHATPRLRFDIVVPAHNEEDEIGQTVASLLAVDYPRDLFRLFVVADNCADRTAQRATQAGAEVMVRNDPDHRGKGYALAYAFARSLSDGFADAIVVVDADSLVSGNLLRAFASRIEKGASVLQADYGVRNPRSSWRTRMMTIALAAFHGVRSLGRERLGLSCGLRGNGMAFTTAVLRAQPPRAFSIVEDLEYGIQLGYAGARIQYVHDATVVGYMAVTEGASRSQRSRWERGRQSLVRQHVPGLLAQAWQRRDLRLLDLALDLLVPPLAQLTVLTVFGLVFSILAATQGAVVAPWVWGISLLSILLYVARGWSLSGAGMRGLLDLLYAPVYIVWKLTLRFRDKGRLPGEWVRTSREVEL